MIKPNTDAMREATIALQDLSPADRVSGRAQF